MRFKRGEVFSTFLSSSSSFSLINRDSDSNAFQSMSLSSDSDNDTSIRSASSKEEEEEKDPQKEAFCKNFERMFGGSQIAIGPGKINMRLMSAQSDETSAVRRLLQFK